MVISYFVAGVPRPQPRHRPSRLGGAKPAKHIAAWKQAVKSATHEALCEAVAPGWQGVSQSYLITTLTSKGLAFVELNFTVKGDPRSPRSGDIDNLVKAVHDALQDAGACKNDAEIVESYAQKHAQGADPASALGVHIRLVYGSK